MEDPGKYPRSIPTNAVNAITTIQGIKDKILKEPKLSRDYIDSAINDNKKPWFAIHSTWGRNSSL